MWADIRIQVGDRLVRTAVVGPRDRLYVVFRLHNDRTAPLRFVYAKAPYNPWGSAWPTVTGPDGRKVHISWSVPKALGANNPRLEPVTIDPGRVWTTVLPLDLDLDRNGVHRWAEGIHRVRVAFGVLTPEQYVAMDRDARERSPGSADTFRPGNFAAIAALCGEGFWSGNLTTDEVSFVCRDGGPSGESRQP